MTFFLDCVLFPESWRRTFPNLDVSLVRWGHDCNLWSATSVLWRGSGNKRQSYVWTCFPSVQFFGLYSHCTKLTYVLFLLMLSGNYTLTERHWNRCSFFQTLQDFSSYNCKEKGHMIHCDRGSFLSYHHRVIDEFRIDWTALVVRSCPLSKGSIQNVQTLMTQCWILADIISQ
jgi:hypothetical protein